MVGKSELVGGANSVTLVFVRLLFLTSLVAYALVFTTSTARAQTALCGSVAAGAYSSGFNCAPAAGTNAALITVPSTEISTSSGADLRAASQNADATISVSGTQITSNVGVLANGVQAQVTGGLGNAGILFSGTLNAITMGTVGDNAVFVQNNTAGTSTVTVLTGTRLNIINNNSSGLERDGIEINSTGSGNASVLFNGSGTITTANGNGIWIKAANGGNALAQVSSAVTINVGKPAAGGNYAGIHTNVTGSGSTQITSQAAINSSGTNAYGIYTQAADGSVAISNAGTITTNGQNGFGIRAATSGAGDIAVDNAGGITTTGQAAHGIYLTSPTGVITLNNDGALTVGSTSATVGSRAVYINSTGDIGITGSGDINVLGSASTAGGYGIIANSTTGNISVDYSGDVTVSGSGASGIRADAIAGNVIVNYSGDRIETFNENGIGIYASSRSATGTVGIETDGTIVTHADNGGGDGSGTGAYGLEAISYGGDINVVYNGPLIDVNGTGAAILAGNAYFTGTGLGTITVENNGDLVARGNAQQGIRAYSTTGSQFITNSGTIETMGASNSQGILALTNGAASLSVANDGSISTVGDLSSGIDAVSQGGVAAISNTGTISAGRGTSAGIATGGIDQSIANSGSVGALSDIAITGDSGGFLGSLDILNSGNLTGVVSASNSSVQLNNSGTWNLRRFAATGTGTRDTLAVAVSNFGTSGANTIDSSGVLALLGDGGAATSLNSAGAYQPLGLASTAMAIGGPVQGQILGVSTFANSGIIDLTTNAAAGDVLLISGGGTAGTDGGGVFETNGGTVRLDTVLNEGGPASWSDVLVLDSTQLGSAATSLAVHNLGGDGALTVGNGIALVEVLNKSASASDVFILDGDYVTEDGQQAVVGGAYAYTLFHNGVGADSADGNWYLRSQLSAADPGTPRYQPGVGIYEAYPQHLLALMTMPTMQQRVGNRYWQEPDDIRARLCRDAATDMPTSNERNCLEDRATIEQGAIWTRIEGAHLHMSPSSAADAKWDTNLWKLQASVDGLIDEDDDGNVLIGGVNVNIGHASSNITSIWGDGSIGTTGLGLGGTLTWLAQNGLYVDSQLSLMWFNSDLSSDTAGLGLLDGDHGFGLAASIESGKKIDVGNDWTVTPQAQLVYSSVDVGSPSDVFGANVTIDRGDSLLGRLGISADHDEVWKDEEDKLRRRHLYGIANLYYEFLDGTRTSVSGTPFDSQPDRLWGGVGLGGSYNWNEDKYSVYGEVSLNTSLQNFGESYAVHGTVGFRVKW